MANPNCISDLGVAGQSAFAGFRGGIMNVRINLPSIKDVGFSESTAAVVAQLATEADKRHRDLEQIVNERLV